ncbi:MAG: hypothetical protein WA109_04325 [Bellilinea sp.]
MRKLAALSIFLLVVLVGVFGVIRVVSGQSPITEGGQQILTQEQDGANLREISAPTGQNGLDAELNIGFIESPTATCYQPNPNVDACYINWYYLSVTSDPNYMVSLEVTLNDFGKVSRSHGFFQTSMYIPFSMLGNGFQVTCGAQVDRGNPDLVGLGNSYAYTIRAKDSAALSSANYGTVYCPAYIP